MPKFLLQNVSTEEVRTIRHASMMDDSIQVNNCSIDSIPIDLLNTGAIPVGSVEFLKECMSMLGIQEPKSIGYPNELTPFMHRCHGISTGYAIMKSDIPIFIKPAKTKLFTGFVLDLSKDQSDQEEYREFMNCNANEPMLWSEVIDIQSEWRYYVDAKRLIGYSRYDQHEYDAPEPDSIIVSDMISRYSNSDPYALDVAVLTTGETVLVEVNDFWAIGLYGKCITPKQYAMMLAKRWRSIRLPYTR